MDGWIDRYSDRQMDGWIHKGEASTNHSFSIISLVYHQLQIPTMGAWDEKTPS